MSFDSNEISLCINCDAEFSVSRFDDEEGEEVQFCPFCGSHLWEDDLDDNEDEEDE